MIDEDEDYNMRQVEKMVSNILVVDDEKINIRLIENICKTSPSTRSLRLRAESRP